MQVTLVEAPRGGGYPSTGAGTGGLASPAQARWLPTPTATPQAARGDRRGGFGTGVTLPIYAS